MTVYDIDVRNPDQLSELIWEMSNRIKDLEDEVKALKDSITVLPGVEKLKTANRLLEEYKAENDWAGYTE